VFVLPNLTPTQAQQIAETKLAKLVRHERVLSAEMAGELILAPRSMVQLCGTGTAFDGNYMVDRVERRIDAGRGFSQHLVAHALN